MTRDDEQTELITNARTEVQAAIDAGPEQAKHAVEAAKAEARRWYGRSVIAAAVVAVLIAGASYTLSSRTNQRVDQQELTLTTLRQIADDAKAQGEEANSELRERGQQPVPIPRPGSDDDSEVLVAAATARVLASLPDTTPSAVSLAAAIGQFVALHPGVFSPSPQQIAESLAAYLMLNPPPAGLPGIDGKSGEPCDPAVRPECRGPQGEKGDQGDQGDPPTSDQIRAEFAAWLRDNPDALCPRGGQFTQLRVQLADGGTADTWTCVVQITQPPPTTKPTTSTLVPIPLLGR